MNPPASSTSRQGSCWTNPKNKCPLLTIKVTLFIAGLVCLGVAFAFYLRKVDSKQVTIIATAGSILLITSLVLLLIKRICASHEEIQTYTRIAAKTKSMEQSVADAKGKLSSLQNDSSK